MADLAKYPRWGNDIADVNNHISGIDGELWERFNLYRNDVRAETGIAIGVSSGYRSYDEQVYLYNCYQERLRTGKCKCGSCNLAAVPGSSPHNFGEAIDQHPDYDVSPAIQRAAERWGLWFPVLSPQREPWHIELISRRKPGYPMPPLPAQPQPSEDPMAQPFIANSPQGELAIFYPGTPFRVHLKNDEAVTKALGRPPFGMGLSAVGQIDQWFFDNTEKVASG